MPEGECSFQYTVTIRDYGNRDQLQVATDARMIRALHREFGDLFTDVISVVPVTVDRDGVEVSTSMLFRYEGEELGWVSV